MHLLAMLTGADVSFVIATGSYYVLCRLAARMVAGSVPPLTETEAFTRRRLFARLEGHGPSKEKEDAEVALLKIQAKICEEDLVTKKATSKGAQIANLKSVMETGELDKEKMAACRKRLYKLATELSFTLVKPCPFAFVR